MKKVDIKHKFFYYDEAEEPVMHVKSGDQIQNGTFPASAGTHQGDKLAFLNRKTDL